MEGKKNVQAEWAGMKTKIANIYLVEDIWFAIEIKIKNKFKYYKRMKIEIWRIMIGVTYFYSHPKINFF